MYKCAVAACPGGDVREETLDRVYQISNGEHVLVYGVPVKVCVNCGELTFSIDNAEKVRSMLYREDGQKPRRVTIPAFEFARSETATEDLLLTAYK